MAWPVGMPLVTITQDVYKLSDGSLPSSYAVHLQLSVPALVFNGRTTLIRRPITLTAEPGSGVISGQVPHLNHPDLSPTPVYYLVTEFADGQRVRAPWQLTPAAEDVTIDLDARAPIAGDPGAPVAVGPPGAPGDAGRDIELRASATHVQWRYVGDPTWTDLVALADLGAQTYDSLDDVDTTGLADGDAMVWDQASGKWVKVSLSSTYAAPTGTDGRLQVGGVDVTPEQVGAAPALGAGGAAALIVPNTFPDSIYAFGSGPGSSSGLELTPDVVFLTPYELMSGARVRRLMVRCLTAPSQAVTIESGIWDSAAQKVASSTLSINTTGNKEVILGDSAIELPPGIYWMCSKVLGTSGYGLLLGREWGMYSRIVPRGNPWDVMDGPPRGLQAASAGTGAIASDLSGVTLAMNSASIGYGYRVA